MNLGTKREHFGTFLALLGCFRAVFVPFRGDLGRVRIALSFQVIEIIGMNLGLHTKTGFHGQLHHGL